MSTAELPKDAWQNYRVLRFAFPVSVILAMLSAFFAGVALHFPNYGVLAATLVVGIPLMFFFTRRLGHWPCPRCKKAFHAGKFYYKRPNRECAYCRFPMWHPYREDA